MAVNFFKEQSPWKPFMHLNHIAYYICTSLKVISTTYNMLIKSNVWYTHTCLFNQWSNNCAIRAIPSVLYTENKSLYAIWSLIQYRVLLVMLLIHDNLNPYTTYVFTSNRGFVNHECGYYRRVWVDKHLIIYA